MELAESTGLQTAWLDARQWIDHYDAVLWNAAIAAMDLHTIPPRNLDSTHVLYIHIHHSRNLSAPVHERFLVQDIRRCSAHTSRHLHENAVAISGRELPNNSYGAVGMCLRTTYDGKDIQPPVSKYLWKYWSVDTSSAAAQRCADWKGLLHSYLTSHARIRFCCTNGVGDCCCGGWVHNDQSRVRPRAVDRESI